MNARQAHLIVQERTRLQNVLGTTFIGHKVRCVTAVAKSILLHGSYFYSGRHLSEPGQPQLENSRTQLFSSDTIGGSLD